MFMQISRKQNIRITYINKPRFVKTGLVFVFNFKIGLTISVVIVTAKPAKTTIEPINNPIKVLLSITSPSR